ncbi:MAG TPA: phytanoyl-CoA dioxygenase family protein [Caulifigura sp.]|nr:phytanoyl-CoA dioxygenase family protein [Caulifigura sp.]
MSVIVADQLAEQAELFWKQGYLVLPNMLTKNEIDAINAVIERSQQEEPHIWANLSESFRQSVDILKSRPEFDPFIENPNTLPLLRKIMGEDITFEELYVMLRDPIESLKEIKGWHRDLTRNYDRRYEIQPISLVYYLSDVSATDHCFSIVPETHARLIDMHPRDVQEADTVDINGPAGTAVVFHARCIHNGKLKPHSRQRRTLHMYFSKDDGVRTSEWDEIPARLHTKTDPSLPSRLYSKWNVTTVFKGTGMKPKMASTATAEELIREAENAEKR